MPRRMQPAARRSAMVSVLVCLLLFIAAACLAGREEFGALDRGTHSLIREGRALALEEPMRFVSALALGWVLLPVALVGSALLWWRGERMIALALPLIGLIAVPVPGLLKWLVNRPRPTLRAYGFPSGHVFAATVFVFLVVYLLWHFEAPRPVQRAARAVGILYVLAVGYSRLYVNAHWLSDVVGGLLGGLAFATVAVLVLDRRLR